MSKSSQKKKNEALGLPTYCPDWCAGGLKNHWQAFMEGCPVEDARVHVSVDHCGFTNDIVNHLKQRLDRRGGAGWDVKLQQDDLLPSHMGMALVRLDMHVWRDDRSQHPSSDRLQMDLTPGEARTLAAQLINLADTYDLR